MASKAPKAPKESVTADDNVKLLLTVIKVCDVKLAPMWDKVAKECGITSGPAAAKRFSRLQKAHGSSPSKGDNDGDGGGTGGDDGADDSSPGAKAGAKKRKAPAEGKGKGGAKAKKIKEEPVKEEEDADDGA